MNYFKTITFILMLIFISCNSENDEKSLEKENEVIEQELELSEKKNELQTKQSLIEEQKQKLKGIKFQPVENFIPFMHKIAERTDIEIGDLNNDAFQDAVVFLENTDIGTDEIPDLKILILLGTEKGKYRQGSKSGDVSSTFSQSQAGVTIKNRVITSCQHISMRAHVELKFRYELSKGKVMLIGSEEVSFGNAAGDSGGTISSNYLTNKRILKFKGEKEQIIKLNSKLTPLQGINDGIINQILQTVDWP